MVRGRLARRGARHRGQGVRGAEARPPARRGPRAPVAGLREKQHRAVQVSSRGGVRRRLAAHRDRQAAALQAEAMTMQILQPPGWARPKGFSNGISCQGRLVFIGGQIGWSGQGEWLERSFAGQFRQALKNILDILADRKSTRLNSSHRCISYAGFCLKKKNTAMWEASKPRKTMS